MNEASIEDWLETQRLASLEPLIEFKSFGKIPRLFRDCVITEKIDGTNAAVGIIKVGPASIGHPDLDSPAVTIVTFSESEKMDGGKVPAVSFAVYAQSRRRVISPFDDNYNFAQWVADNAVTLVRDLGPGLHFGEWWGQGIQRNYGQRQKIFSLFNVHKWEGAAEYFETPNMRVVPVVDRHTFDTGVVRNALDTLLLEGSLAAPGYGNPEGVVVFHPQAGALFKATLENDCLPKSLAQQVASVSEMRRELAVAAA
jgi:hypothetical protein